VSHKIRSSSTVTGVPGSAAIDRDRRRGRPEGNRRAHPIAGPGRSERTANRNAKFRGSQRRARFSAASISTIATAAGGMAGDGELMQQRNTALADSMTVAISMTQSCTHANALSCRVECVRREHRYGSCNS
jgi:hypothetical protein